LFAIVVVRRKTTGDNINNKNTPTLELRWENPKEWWSALIEARETEEEECVERREKFQGSKITPKEERERKRERDGTTKVDQKVRVENRFNGKRGNAVESALVKSIHRTKNKKSKVEKKNTIAQYNFDQALLLLS